MVRRNDPERTRAAIMEAAQRIFLERGPAGTSLRQIADLSGVNKSLIHHHFGSKDGLWSEVKRAQYGRYQALLLGIIESNPEPDSHMLAMLATASFTFFKENPAFVRLGSWINVEGDTDCAEMARSLFEKGAAWIERAQLAGIVRPEVSPRFLFMTMWSISVHWFEGRHQFRLLKPDNVSEEALDDAYLEQVISFIHQGIAVEPLR